MAPQAITDPYASIATPVAPEPGLLQHVEDVGAGLVKGAGDTVGTVGRIINKIPLVGETLSPKEGLNALDQLDTSKNGYQSVGKGLETAGEVAMTAGASGDLEMLKGLQEAEKLSGAARAAKYVDLAKKYPPLADTFNLATNHPWLSKMILEGGKGAVVGGVEGAVKGRSVSAAATGAAAGAATGAAVAASPMLTNPFKRAASAAGDYISDIWQGAGAAQEPTQAAVREGAQAAGITVQPQELRTALEHPIDMLESQASENYKAMDTATNGKFQPNVDALKNVNKELQAVAGTNPAREAELESAKIRLEWQRDQLLDEAVTKGVPKETVTLAKTQFRQAQALNDLDSKVFKNLNVVDLDGNVKVDAALKALQKLQDNTTWGAPRLTQALGKDAADTLLQSLRDARQQGITALSRQKWAVLAAKVAGAAGALT